MSNSGLSCNQSQFSNCSSNIFPKLTSDSSCDGSWTSLVHISQAAALSLAGGKRYTEDGARGKHQQCSLCNKNREDVALNYKNDVADVCVFSWGLQGRNIVWKCASLLLLPLLFLVHFPFFLLFLLLLFPLSSSSSCPFSSFSPSTKGALFFWRPPQPRFPSRD